MIAKGTFGSQQLRFLLTTLSHQFLHCFFTSRARAQRIKPEAGAEKGLHDMMPSVARARNPVGRLLLSPTLAIPLLSEVGSMKPYGGIKGKRTNERNGGMKGNPAYCPKGHGPQRLTMTPSFQS